MKEQIERRIKELEAQREKELAHLQQQAQQQMAAMLAPLDASINELKKLIEAKE